MSGLSQMNKSHKNSIVCYKMTTMITKRENKIGFIELYRIYTHL